MSCSNCFNGCAEIISDKCVRYTGINVPALGIENGDSLAHVEQVLIEFLTSALDGTGIKMDIPSGIICNLVEQYLPTSGDITLVDFITALIEAACDLQEQVDSVVSDISTIEASYDVDCLTGVNSNSGTHAILQAVIDKLCDLEVGLDQLSDDLDLYVKLADLNSLIQDYLDSISGGTTQQYTKMVPYTVVEYYGSLSNFDGAGVGISALGWDKIYICNGQVVGGFPTPDKRGRIAVGAIQSVPGGGALDPVVAPGGFNPNYVLYGTSGANSVTLIANQMPTHTHVVTLNDPGHKHVFGGDDQIVTQGGYLATGSSFNYDADSTTSGAGRHMFTKNTSVADTPQTTGITVSSVSDAGGNQPHNNIPPVLACYYIMYIP